MEGAKLGNSRVRGGGGRGSPDRPSGQGGRDTTGAGGPVLLPGAREGWTPAPGPVIRFLEARPERSGEVPGRVEALQPQAGCQPCSGSLLPGWGRAGLASASGSPPRSRDGNSRRPLPPLPTPTSSQCPSPSPTPPSGPGPWASQSIDKMGRHDSWKVRTLVDSSLDPNATLPWGVGHPASGHREDSPPPSLLSALGVGLPSPQGPSTWVPGPRT